MKIYKIHHLLSMEGQNLINIAEDDVLFVLNSRGHLIHVVQHLLTINVNTVFKIFDVRSFRLQQLSHDESENEIEIQ